MRAPQVVGVEKSDPIARRLGDTAVARAAGIADVDLDDTRAPSTGELGGGVLATVGHDDVLGGWAQLRQDGVDRLLQGRDRVVSRYHDSNV
jgi:hypothetical protein